MKNDDKETIEQLKEKCCRAWQMYNQAVASNSQFLKMYETERFKLNKADAEISELKAALAKTTDENLELVEKCEKLDRVNEMYYHAIYKYHRENKLHKKVCENLNNDLFDLHNKYESKLHRQKELIRSLKKQRRYLVHRLTNYKNRYEYIMQNRNMYKRYLFEEIRERDLTILDLNKQIGEMRVKLANTVTKMKEKQFEPSSKSKDAAIQSTLQALVKARKINWFEAIQCGLKANLPERPENENIVSNHKYNITVNGRRI